MVKKFLKSKSKRVPAARRYKIEKKIREHNKKLKRVEKTKLKAKHRKNKMITVPGDCPFKLQILTEAKNVRDEIKSKKEAKKELIREKRKAKKEAQKATTTENSGDAGAVTPALTKSGSVKLNAGDVKEKAVPTFEELRKKAEERGYQFEKFEQQQQKAKKAGQSDSSLKAFYREFQQVISESDVIIQVLDSRDPLGTRSTEAEELVRNSTDKKLLLVLNKCDLVPLDNLQKWIAYLKQTVGCSVLPFKSNTQKQKDRYGSVATVTNADAMETKKSIGVSDLMGLLGAWARDSAGGLTIGVIGTPNVGKSSLINSLKRSKACNVGAKPGVTRACQVVQLDSKLRLIDSPGVCFDKDKGKDGISIETIVARVPRTTLMLQYGIPEFQNIEEFLAHVASKFGQIKKGGLPNTTAAEQKIIHDWHIGTIRFFTETPEFNYVPDPADQNSALFTSLSKPFSLDNFTPNQMDVEMEDHDDASGDDEVVMESDSEEENTKRTTRSKTKKKVSFAVNTEVLDAKERKKLKQEFNDTHPHLQKKPSTVGVVATKKQFNKKIRKSKKKSTKKADALSKMVEDFNF